MSGPSVFVLPTGIFITVIDSEGNPVSIIRRIRKRTVNLEQVEKVNSFSRSLKDRTLSYQEAMAGLKDIAALDGYGYVLKLIVAGNCSFCICPAF